MGAEDEQKPGEKKDEGEEKGTPFSKKMFKVMTVMVYVSAISGAGVLLSLYYIVLWDPQIKGVRPPGYLRTGELVGDPKPLVATIPQALRGNEPIAYPHKMSREFMNAYYNNDSDQAEVRPSNDMMEGQPTPMALPVVMENNYEGAHHHQHAHVSPTEPISNQPTTHSPVQGSGPNVYAGDSTHQLRGSSVLQQQQERNHYQQIQQLQEENQQQHQQQQQQPLTANA